MFDFFLFILNMVMNQAHELKSTVFHRLIHCMAYFSLFSSKASTKVLNLHCNLFNVFRKQDYCIVANSKMCYYQNGKFLMDSIEQARQARLFL